MKNNTVKVSKKIAFGLYKEGKLTSLSTTMKRKKRTETSEEDNSEHQ